MKISTSFQKILLLIFLVSCNSIPIQSSDTNFNTLTPPSHIATPNATIQSTLLPHEQESLIKDLMATNAGCDLPCFWGISPATNWEDAEEFLLSIGATIGNTEKEPGVTYHAVIFENLNLASGNDRLGFLESNGVIESIFAGSDSSGSERNEAEYASLWAMYSPKEIVKKYGIPSRVLLSSVYAPGFGDTGRHGYILWVFYDHLGFMLRYDGSAEDLPIYHICPQLKENGDITRIDLRIQSPSSLTPLELRDAILSDNKTLRVILSIEEASGITVEEFHNLFVQDENPSCFDTPRDFWKIEQ